MRQKSAGRSGLLLLLAGALLLSVTACKPNGGSSKTSSEEASSDAPAAVEIPTLPVNTVLVTEPDASDFLIAENGIARAAIVIPASPTDKVKTAAEDLQKYLHAITGASIPLYADSEEPAEEYRILVGPTAQTAALKIEQPTGYPDKEKVLLKREDNQLILLGNDDMTYHGTEYAVTMLLEYLGCGWFGPDELWQVIPLPFHIGCG